jgi:hypothetical protein
MGVPARVALRMLGGDARRGAVGTAEHDRAAHLAARHVERLGGRVDDLVDRLHGEVEGHELDDRLQPAERSADAEAGKAVLGDRRVDDALGAELLEQALAHLVGALVLRDFLAHQEDGLVARISSPWRRAAPRARSCAGCRPSIPAQAPARRRQGLRALPRPSASLRISEFPSGPRPWRLAPASRRRRRSRLRQPGRDRRVDGDALGAFLDEDPGDRAFVDGLDLHGRLVGLDLADHLAGLHFIALLDFSHLASLPSVMVGDRAGIKT